MTEPTELLPCPFCGGAPTTIERPYNIDGTQFFYAIACYCGRHSACAHKMAVRKTPEIAKADAIAAWNTRTPQAGAVPLTDEQIKEVMDLVSDWGVQSHLRGEAELDAHNPEATEDEITYAKECAEKERAAWNAIKDKLQAHGIKGGQHGGM